MREYEVTFVLQPELNEADRTALIERIQGWLIPEGTEIPEPTVNHWGQRQLAYPIRDYTEGYYLYYEIMVDPTRIADIERNIKFNDDILRHLFVRKDEA
jgi:small subunit ribosomal protein S6